MWGQYRTGTRVLILRDRAITSYSGQPFASSPGTPGNHFLTETWPSPLGRDALAIVNAKRTAFMWPPGPRGGRWGVLPWVRLPCCDHGSLCTLPPKTLVSGYPQVGSWGPSFLPKSFDEAWEGGCVLKAATALQGQGHSVAAGVHGPPPPTHCQLLLAQLPC